MLEKNLAGLGKKQCFSPQVLSRESGNEEALEKQKIDRPNMYVYDRVPFGGLLPANSPPDARADF